ncbi:MAG TPA: S1 RNA-binding domain-containing protein, partial [Thermoguttaceae bacterium]|nr:S1 RNA-binding domain-containing protein [Thermoguttaceae bacterium]
MLINVRQPEECRIAIIEDGVLEELYVERTGQDNYVGNIYKGVVVNLEPSIQAAFVDFGVGRNGFLHISDVEPQYFRQGGFDPNKPLGPDGGRGEAKPPSASAADPDETADGPDETADGPDDEPPAPRPRGRTFRTGGRPRIKPPIQDVLRRGD